MATKRQKLAQVRNWRKGRLKGIYGNLHSFNVGANISFTGTGSTVRVISPEEQEKLNQAASIIKEVLDDWDTNYKLLKNML